MREPFFHWPEAGAGELGGEGVVGFFVDGEIGVEAGGVGVVVAVLVVEGEEVAEVFAGLGEAGHAFVAAGFGGGGEDVGVLAVVAFLGPRGEDEHEVVDTGGFEGFETIGDLVEGGDVVVEGGFCCRIEKAVGFDVGEGAHAGERGADELFDDGTSCDFFGEGDEKAGVDRILSVALGEGDVVSFGEEDDAACAHVGEFAEGFAPAGADGGGAAGGVGEVVGGIIGGFDDGHRGGFAFLPAPPGHGPVFDDVGLDFGLFVGVGLGAV